MGFYEDMKMNQKSVTKNGAVGYATSGHPLVDLNFAAGSFRGADVSEMTRLFTDAYAADPVNTIRWLFFLRDIKGGLGERDAFRILLRNAISKGWIEKDRLPSIFYLIEKYGRYDDFITLATSHELIKGVVEVLSNRLAKDMMYMRMGKPITLLGKWMPSINTSSKETKALARAIIKQMGMREVEYRKMLAELRKYTNVVETQISRNRWDKIKYEGVPSQANLKYKNAFMKHDGPRYREYIAQVNKGEAKINAGTLYPADIVHRYGCFGWSRPKIDDTLEALWKALPNDEISNTLVVADGSGSMTWGNSSIRPIDVANALAIYFSERNHGEFANKYITFSRRPQFVEFYGLTTLRDKLALAYEHDECANTDIEAVFNLILSTAIKHKTPQSQMPERILIISDMEFDEAAAREYDETLFESIAKKYAAAGYKLPRLVFWNVNSRTKTIPMQENEEGVILVSGYSTHIADLVMSEKTDPYEALLEKLKEYKDVDIITESTICF